MKLGWAGLAALASLELLVLPAASAARSAEATPKLHRADPATTQRANAWLTGTASGWTPNLGQVADAEGHTATNVLYTGQLPGAQVAITTTGLSHVFVKREDDDEEEQPGEADWKAKQYEWARIDLELRGATIVPQLAHAEDRIDGQGGTNYYLPQCPQGVLDVRSYRRVTIPGIYPGVDWVFRSRADGEMHHDFIVHPGADPSAIQLEYNGAQDIEASPDGQSLRIRTELGEVREGALSCYQRDPSNPVQARFRVEGRSVSIVVDNYDHAFPLTIDPPLTWSTYYGDSGYDGSRTVFCDNVNDKVYVVGYTSSLNLPTYNPLGGAHYQGTNSGGVVGFILKFTQAGVREWATYYGGSGGDLMTDCAVDPSGNLYVTGSTGSANLPTMVLAGAYNDATLGGLQDAYVAKFNTAGVLKWATYFGGTQDEYANGITTDPTGRVYVTGASYSVDLPTVNPGSGTYFQGLPNSTVDAFILRFGNNDALQWSTYYGGAGGDDVGGGIIATPTRLYVTGWTFSPSFPTYNPLGGAYFQASLNNFQDAFILRFSLAGVRDWATYFGGDSLDQGDEPVVDANGNMFMIGMTQSPSFPTVNPGGGAYYQAANAGGWDFFLAKFSPTNAQVWCTYLGGTVDEFLQGCQGKPLALNSQGHLFATAMTTATNFPTQNQAGSYFQGTAPGASDAILGEFSNNGNMLWMTYWGTAVVDFGTGVSIGIGDCLFATGESWDGGNMVVQNPGYGAWYTPTNQKSDDVYILKFCSPTSSCCVDNNCNPVSSLSQCNAMGGIYHPNQTCANVVCTIDCTICGKKFNDLNHNGVQDGGEGGLPGWTIGLYYPGGSLFATATTDANGNYCFNNLPCGSWVVREISVPGWVQTYPAGGSYTLNLGVGTTQNAVNFGNYQCGAIVPCGPSPPWQSAWWGFNEGPGATTASDQAHLDPARNAAQIFSGPGGGGSSPDALCLSSSSNFARVPAANQEGLDFGDGSFSIAAWIDPISSSSGPRMLIDKRATSPGGEVGWAMFLNGQQAFLEVAAAGALPQVVPGPVVTPDTWSTSRFRSTARAASVAGTSTARLSRSTTSRPRTGLFRIPPSSPWGRTTPPSASAPDSRAASAT